jgi:hypothetical protein
VIVLGKACQILQELSGQNYNNDTTNYEHFFQPFLIIHLLTQAVSRRLSNVQALFRSQASHCGICGGQNDNGRSNFLGACVFHCHEYFIHLRLTLYQLLSSFVASVLGPYILINTCSLALSISC